MTYGPGEIAQRANHYRLRAHRRSRAHYLACKRNGSLHIRLGVPVVIATTIVGTAIFGTLSSSPAFMWIVLTGLLSITAAVLASLQTFFRFSEAAEKHRVAAASYAALYRKLDLFQLKLKNDPKDTNSLIAQLEHHLATLDELEAASLDIPDHMYDRAVREQKDDVEGV
jgi:hypothetical protein